MGECEPCCDVRLNLIVCCSQVLSDPQKRRIYDAYGEDGLKGGGPGDGPSASGFQGFRARDAEDIFAEVLNHPRSCNYSLIHGLLCFSSSAHMCSSLAAVALLPFFRVVPGGLIKCFSALQEALTSRAGFLAWGARVVLPYRKRFSGICHAL
jgi:hypothetical protein